MLSISASSALDKNASDAAPRVAAAVTTACAQAVQVLAPIIGEQGAAAVYWRSLRLTAAQHPWLAALFEAAQPKMNLPELASTLSMQSAEDASATGSSLLHTFDVLLASLIGEALTRRLLQPVWASVPGLLWRPPTAPDVTLPGASA